jgi:hypothetical protein
MTLILLGVNSIVSIKSLFKVLTIHYKGVFLLYLFTLISTHLLALPDGKIDIEGEGFWRRGKGPLLQHTRENNHTPYQ